MVPAPIEKCLETLKSKFGNKRSGDEELDRNVEEEIARNLWANHRMLPPESPFKKRWDLTVVILVMYNAIFIPIILGYNRYNPKTGIYWYELENGRMVNILVLDYLIDVFFVVDIGLKFRTTYFDQDNELVLDKMEIRRRYMKRSFWLDVFATTPFELLGYLWPPHRLLLWFKVFRLLRVFKVFAQLDVHNQVLRVTEMLLFFLVVAHIVGALWWSLGVADFNRDPEDIVYGRPPGTSWVIRAEVCPHYKPGNTSDGIDHYCEDAPLMQRFMSSLYWSLTTLIKTPWIHPDTFMEKLFASVFVVFGAIVFAAILGNITAMINSFDKSNAQLRDIMSTLHRLIGKYEVPAKLQKRVFMFVQTQWSTTKGLDNQRILLKIPPALRGDILEAIHADLVQTSPILQKVSHECVRVLLSKLKSEVCLAKETLLAPGQLCTEVYILVRGVLQVQPAEDTNAESRRKSTGGGFKNKMLFRAIEKTGSLVGMRDPFEKDFRFPFQVVAVKQAQLVSLSAKDLMEVFAMDNRQDIEAICEVLEKEYNDVFTALVKSEEGRRTSLTRRRSSQSDSDLGVITDHEEIHTRLSVIEDTLRNCDAETRLIQQHLQLLPQLCDLLNIPTSSLDASPS